MVFERVDLIPKRIARVGYTMKYMSCNTLADEKGHGEMKRRNSINHQRCNAMQSSVRSLLVVRPGAPSSFLFLLASYILLENHFPERRNVRVHTARACAALLLTES